MSKLASKLERPPYVHNFVRYIYPDVPQTTKALVSFALGRPPYTYLAGNKVIADRILLGIDRLTALKAAAQHGHQKSRPLNVEYVDAFFDYDESIGLSRLPSFDQVVEPFRISRSISVPVKPLAVCSEAGRLKAVFSVGWASMPLIRSQWRLLFTMIEDAVFTLSDFRDADGVFCAFPRTHKAMPGSRAALVASRGDYELLNSSELQEQLDVYLTALENSQSILRAMVEPVDMQETVATKHPEPSQPDLFSRLLHRPPAI